MNLAANDRISITDLSLIIGLLFLFSLGNLQISVSKYIAGVFDLTARRDVIVEKVSPQKACVDFVEISFKDQYIGRSDMWRLKRSLCDSCAYVGKKISFSCIRVSYTIVLDRYRYRFRFRPCYSLFVGYNDSIFSPL